MALERKQGVSNLELMCEELLEEERAKEHRQEKKRQKKKKKKGKTSSGSSVAGKENVADPVNDEEEEEETCDQVRRCRFVLEFTFFSSPEQKVLRVRYCDQSLSVVVLSVNFFTFDQTLKLSLGLIPTKAVQSIPFFCI